VANTVGTLCSVEDETGNISQITSPESGNSMGKLVMDTRGNVYSPDGKSNCVYKLSSDFELPLKSSTKMFMYVPIYIYWCDVATRI
jgi:hypothetical protein